MDNSLKGTNTGEEIMMSKELELLDSRIVYHASQANEDENYVRRLIDDMEDKVKMLDTMRSFLRLKAANAGKDPEKAVEKASYRAIRAAAVYAYTLINMRKITFQMVENGFCDRDFDGVFMVEAIKKELGFLGANVNGLEW